MKLHGLARVKNEGDVIEEFVRHNLQYLDALTIVDNASFDGTVSILEALRAEGVPLTILRDNTLTKRQAERMTRLSRRSAAEFDWDFLFLLDADEFLKVPDRNRLETSLSELSPHENGLLPLLTYVPTAHDSSDAPRVLDRIRHRRAVEAEPAYYKCVLSRGFVNGGEFAVSQGNHLAYHPNGEAPCTVLTDVALAHFPVRSLAQIQGKVLTGWGAYLAMGFDSVGMGWHQRRLFEKLESAPWSADDLYAVALLYSDQEASSEDVSLCYDPLAPAPISRYGDSSLSSPMQLAARYVRQLAGALAQRDATAALHLPLRRYR